MNVILVIIDSLRMDHIGCYADEYPSGGRARTPNLDRLGAESLRFTRAAPESLPTLPCRRALHTGRRVWPFRYWFQPKGDFVGAPGWGPIEEEADTLAELLSAAGYSTAFITDTYHQFKPGKNFHRGFQQWEWIRGQERDPWRTGPRVPEEQVLRHIPPSMRGIERYVKLHHIYLQNVAGRRTEEDYFCAQVFRKAADWLHQNQEAEKFFLVVDSFDPHEPWDPPEHYRRMYDPSGDEVADVTWALYGTKRGYTPRELRRMQANYAGEATMVDRWFGHFYDAFLDSGRARDTLFILTTDHGHYLGDQGLTGKMGYPLIREVLDVPVFLRDPKGRRRGRAARDLVMHHDVAATILAACRVKPKQRLDGRNLLPALDGRAVGRDHTLTGWGPYVGVRTGRWYYNSTLWGHAPLLFDTTKDPLYTHNVAARNPDIVRRMHALVKADGGGDYPPRLKEMAESALPGCTPLEKA